MIKRNNKQNKCEHCGWEQYRPGNRVSRQHITTVQTAKCLRDELVVRAEVEERSMRDLVDEALSGYLKGRG